MIRRVPRWAWLLLAVIVLLLAAVSVIGPRDRQALFASFGRLHPALVHLPIGALVAAGLLVALARRGRMASARAAVTPVLVLAAVGAVGAVLAGQGLVSDGGYAGATFEWHRVLGYAVAVLSTLAAVASWWSDARPMPTHIADGLLALGLAALAITGHLGGTMTHGEGYLTERLPAPLAQWFGRAEVGTTTRRAQPGDVKVYDELVAPVLQDHCVSCHGPDKANGDLRLDTPDHIRAGGRTGTVVVAGQASASDLVRRLWLPPAHKDAMPPKARPAMPPADASLLRWWVDQGASFDQTLADVEIAPEVTPAIQARVGDLALDTPALSSADPGPLDEQSLAALVDQGLPVHRLSEQVDWLQVAARGRGASFGDAQLAALIPVATHILWMDLGGTAVTDAGVAQLTQFPHLARLHLDRTTVSDMGVAALVPLAHLASLNIYDTQVSDQGLQQLASLRGLRTLYAANTAITADGVALVSAQRPDLTVHRGVTISTPTPTATAGERAARPTTSP